ncbi:hypothetical protein NXF77_24000, partial [Klebsiella pneumoniae]|nr:hypothetical protein [Klebsiella pneumoniae]MDS7385246.1 hypothetical protein [Klebsiella pneumoniae]
QTETEATGAPQKHHYTLNQQVGSITCSLNRERQERFFNIKAGEKKAARVFTDANGDLDIRPTTIN